ncbi:hypothetical protein B7P43_G16017, partial [Cryptotermes secundus]
RIKLNETKSTYMNFTNQKLHQRSISLNGVRIPPANTAKYLGMTLDAKLRWKEHIKKKQKELQIKFRKMNWLIGRRSELSMYKLLLYKQMLRPVWRPTMGMCKTMQHRSNLTIMEQGECSCAYRFSCEKHWEDLGADARPGLERSVDKKLPNTTEERKTAVGIVTDWTIERSEFESRKNCGDRETVIARLCPHATIEEVLQVAFSVDPLQGYMIRPRRFSSARAVQMWSANQRTKEAEDPFPGNV